MHRELAWHDLQCPNAFGMGADARLRLEPVPDLDPGGRVPG
jgi:hypothetical protein